MELSSFGFGIFLLWLPSNYIKNVIIVFNYYHLLRSHEFSVFTFGRKMSMNFHFFAVNKYSVSVDSSLFISLKGNLQISSLKIEI